MIAITALLATVFPNVGPIEVEEKFLVPATVPLANLASRAAWTFLTDPGPSVLVEI